MNNTKRYWKLANCDNGNPTGTYDLLLDYWVIEVDSPVHGRVTHEKSISGKTIYSLAYAQYCLKEYQSMYSQSHVWIEPCYQVVSRNNPY